MRGPMKGADPLKMLENGGIKADEIKWTGLGDLAGKERVTPEEVRTLLVNKGAAKMLPPIPEPQHISPEDSDHAGQTCLHN